MTSIKDLETQIEGAEDALAFAKGELAELKTRLRELKEQEKDKQPEQESLFGRWATHPEHGRGIIISDKPDFGGEVKFAYHWNPEDEDPTTCHYVNLGGLALDPATLTTQQDFQDAPKDTIVEAITEPHDVYVKAGARWYIAGYTSTISSEDIPACRVIRWGNGQ